MAGYDGLDPQFSTRLQAMVAASGGRVWITSGYRSPEKQAQLFAAAVKKYGSEEAARKWVAPPGKSHHNLGIAADLGFSDAAARQWVHAHAGDYGLYFPMDWEPWHIEPLGLSAKGNRDAYTTAPTGYVNPVDAANAVDPHDPGVQMQRLLGIMTGPVDTTASETPQPDLSTPTISAAPERPEQLLNQVAQGVQSG